MPARACGAVRHESDIVLLSFFPRSLWQKGGSDGTSCEDIREGQAGSGSQACRASPERSGVGEVVRQCRRGVLAGGR